MSDTTLAKRPPLPPREEDDAPTMASPVALRGELVEGMSEEAFLRFAEQNRELRMERETDKTITIMSPTSYLTGIVNSYLIEMVSHWARTSKSGRAGESQTGYTLPDGSVRSPDVSFLSKEKARQLPKSEKRKFPKVVPEFVIELKSPTDSWIGLQRKMESYMENGVRLGWLFDAEKELVIIYRQGQEPELIEGFAGELSGEEVMEGFAFSLDELKAYIDEEMNEGRE